jgi:hypothetical protein
MRWISIVATKPDGSTTQPERATGVVELRYPLQKPSIALLNENKITQVLGFWGGNTRVCMACSLNSAALESSFEVQMNFFLILPGQKQLQRSKDPADSTIPLSLASPLSKTNLVGLNPITLSWTHISRLNAHYFSLSGVPTALETASVNSTAKCDGVLV